MVEGVEVQDGSGDSGGEFPPEELRSEIVTVSQLQTFDRMARRFQTFDRRVHAGIGISEADRE